MQFAHEIICSCCVAYAAIDFDTTRDAVQIGPYIECHIHVPIFQDPLSQRYLFGQNCNRPASHELQEKRIDDFDIPFTQAQVKHDRFEESTDPEVKETEKSG